MFSVSKKIQNEAISWVMAKGLGVVALIITNILFAYAINKLWTNQNMLQKQMYELQNSVIRENTQVLSEFKLKNHE